MQTRNSTTDGFWPLHDALTAWIQQELPALNQQVEDGHRSPDEFTAVVRPWISEVGAKHVPSVRPISRWETRKLIQLLGFPVSSVERHFQAAGAAPGTGLSRLPGMDHILSTLASVAQHPPRDSHYSYWLDNTGEKPLTFTGDPQEVFFNRVVCLTHDLHTSSCNAMRPICQGYIAAASDEAATALSQAAENTIVLHKRFQSFMEKDAVEPGRRSMEPHFFMTRMRTYLPTYPIKGESWGGVNAANLAAQMQMDYLLGTTNAQYGDIVRGRRRYLIPEDWHALEEDMALPSVIDLLLSQLQLSRQAVAACDHAALKAHIASQAPGLQASLMAYARLFHAAGKLTAMHWALIQNYLVKPAAQLSPEAQARLPVAPVAGTGGKSHAETKGIMQMRLDPVLKKLVDGIHQALGARA